LPSGKWRSKRLSPNENKLPSGITRFIDSFQ
jgi:hypothetical protein